MTAALDPDQPAAGPARATASPLAVLRGRPDFARLWIAQVVSVTGDGMQRLALLWWASQHGGTGALVAVSVAAIVPLVAGSPLGGWLADRHDRRRLLVGADLLRAATTGLLAYAMVGGSPSVALVCALLAVTGLGTAVFDPTYAATVPTVVPPEDRAAANGLNLANSAAGGLVGPLLAGLLLPLLGIGSLLALNAATFLWSATFVRLARLPAPAAEEEPGAVEGPGALRLVRRHPTLRRLVCLAATLNLVVAPVSLLLVALVADRYRAGVGMVGLLQAALSLGLLGGALAAGVLAARRRSMPTSMFAVAAGCGALAVVPAGAAVPAMVAIGVAIAVANTSLLTRFQHHVPPELLGRVFGVVGAMAEGLRPLGLVAAGPLLALLGVSGAFVVVGVGVAIATAWWAVPLSRGSAASRPLADAPTATG